MMNRNFMGVVDDGVVVFEDGGSFGTIRRQPTALEIEVWKTNKLLQEINENLKLFLTQQEIQGEIKQ